MTPEHRAEAQRLAHELDRAQSDAFDLSTQQGAALRAAAALLRALLDAPAQALQAGEQVVYVDHVGVAGVGLHRRRGVGHWAVFCCLLLAHGAALIHTLAA